MSIKLNYTNFTHACMGAKITAAMDLCLKTGEPVRVTNRRGAEFLLVTIHRHSPKCYHFTFHSMYEHEEVGMAILRAHHYWPAHQGNAFWSLHSAAMDLKEHPWVTASRNEAQKVITGVPVGVPALVTHRFTTVNGTIYYGTIKRDWRWRQYVLIAGLDGVLVKPTTEFLSCITLSEAL